MTLTDRQLSFSMTQLWDKELWWKLEGIGGSEPEREEREQPLVHLQWPPHFCTSRYSPLFTPEGKHTLKHKQRQGGGCVNMLMVESDQQKNSILSVQQQISTWSLGGCFSPLTPRSTASSVLSLFISTTMLSLLDFSLVLQDQTLKSDAYTMQ